MAALGAGHAVCAVPELVLTAGCAAQSVRNAGSKPSIGIVAGSSVPAESSTLGRA
jgi:hypothetical protein